MPEEFREFVAGHPIWGIFILILMALPLVGAVAWVVMRALRKPEDTFLD
jgi:flagellar biogenesis protein FliO